MSNDSGCGHEPTDTIELWNILYDQYWTFKRCLETTLTRTFEKEAEVTLAVGKANVTIQ